MKHTDRPAVSLTPCGRLADATFPQALENAPGFPQTHSLDDEIFLLTSYRGTDAPHSLEECAQRPEEPPVCSAACPTCTRVGRLSCTPPPRGLVGTDLDKKRQGSQESL